MTTYIVTTNIDELDAGATAASPGGTGLSLREAIALANASVGVADTITFDSAVFTGGAASLIRLTQGQITIDGAVTIDGSTATGVTITGDKNGDDKLVAGTSITDVAASYGGTAGAANDFLDDNSRIFEILSSSATTLDSLTITGGRSTAASSGGGAIVSSSDLTILSSTVAGNSTTGVLSGGGAILAVNLLTVKDSTISGNSTSGDNSIGGGIWSRETALLTNSTVSGNSTIGQSAAGGGILGVNVGLNNSTIAGNFTNGSESPGGGVLASSFLSAANTTVTGNWTVGSLSPGGGLAAPTLVLTNSIVLGNFTAQSAGEEIEGTLSARGVNIVGTGADTDPSDGVVNADPTLVFAQTVDTGGGVLAGVLANNGGQIETIALKLDITNPALDASNTSAPATDAIGNVRFDHARIANANGSAADLGAAEAGELPSFVVTTNLDVVDAFDGKTSLREAVAFANSKANADAATPDVITFDASVFTGGAASLIRLTQGEIQITDAVTIDGSTATGITITGDKNGDDKLIAGTDITDVAASYAGALGAASDFLDDNSRIFNVTLSTAATTLDSLTLTGGRTTGFDGGGAIRSVAALTISNSSVSGNSTINGDGGGIEGTIVSLTNSTVTLNATSGFAADGGGIFTSSSLTLTGSTVANNWTTGNVANGGGIDGGLGSVTLTNSTLSGNTTIGGFAEGGAIHTLGAVTLTNSTVSGNSTSGGSAIGGGILSGTASLINSTITGNSSLAQGGGIYSLGNVTLTNSIVLGNESAGSSQDEAYSFGGVLVANGLNIVGAGSDTDGSDGSINADPTLVFAQTVANGSTFAGVLANNGGPVQTVALNLDMLNPALDAARGTPTAADARGIAANDIANLDNNGPDTAVRDLGAFELANHETQGLVVTTNLDVVDAFDGKTSLREAVLYANATANADANTPDVITFDASVFTGGVASLIRLTQGEIVITDAVTIDGSTATGVTITGDKNDDDVTVAGTDITDVTASGVALLDDNSRLFNVTTLSSETTLSHLTLTGGRTLSNGGAVFSLGKLNVVDSMVSGNSATNGGGIWAVSAIVEKSTVTGNEATLSGGGVAGALTLRLINSTLSDNAAGASGGGGQGNVVDLVNSTVTGNTAASQGGIDAARPTIINSIVLGNSSDEVNFDINVQQEVNYSGLNIVGTGGDTDGSEGRINADPTKVFAQTVDIGGGVLAGVLADNGGPVQTVALRAALDNPAIDRADATAPATDARDVARVDHAGIANNGGSFADLGAYELADAAPIKIVLTNVRGPLAETASTASPIKIADIVVSDPDGGPNTLSLSGADADLFQIVGDALFLRQGARLDFETNPSLDVSVGVSADLNGPGIDRSAGLSLAVTDVVEQITGTPKADVLRGTGAAELILGLAGNDRILGGGGNDIINGGRGVDRMTGGPGSDTFVFRSTLDSGWELLGRDSSGVYRESFGAGLRDIITDFQVGIDHIDLSAIDANVDRAGNQTFKFLGESNFNGGGAVIFRTFENKTIVYGDNDGDRLSDFQIELTGVKELKAGDFVL